MTHHHVIITHHVIELHHHVTASVMITSEAGNSEKLHVANENAWQKTTRATKMWRTRTAQAGEVEGCEQRRGSIERHERLLVRLVQMNQ